MASERYYHFIAQSIAIYILYRFVLSPSRNLWKVTHKTKRYVCIGCVCLWNYTFAGVISFGKLGPERSWYTCQRNLCVSFIDVKNKQRKSAIWGIPWIRPWNEDEWYIPWIKKRNVSNADGFGAIPMENSVDSQLEFVFMSTKCKHPILPHTCLHQNWCGRTERRKKNRETRKSCFVNYIGGCIANMEKKVSACQHVSS